MSIALPSLSDHGPSLLGVVSRRDALRAGGLSALALGGGRAQPAATRPAPSHAVDSAVILVVLVGGPSPWETFDPQPDAPSERRGPFGSIATAVPGVRLTEHLPLLARRLDQFTLIRSLHHDGDPTHVAGLRLLLTGQLPVGFAPLTARVGLNLGVRGGVPPVVILSDAIARGETSLLAHADPAARRLDRRAEPFVVGGVPGSTRFDPARLQARLRDRVERLMALGAMSESGHASAVSPLLGDWPATPGWVRASYGESEFGRNCWLARQLVAAGCRFVVVPTARTVFAAPSWDAHGRAPFRTFDDYARTLLPAFDRGMAALADDLRGSGRLDSTLVVATGEMGRTPWINESGGRDHWPGVWSGLTLGGGWAGGRFIGASDSAGQPRDCPVPAGELVPMMARHLGLEPDPAVASGVGSVLDSLLS